jgi:hypothetical protein
VCAACAQDYAALVMKNLDGKKRHGVVDTLAALRPSHNQGRAEKLARVAKRDADGNNPLDALALSQDERRVALARKRQLIDAGVLKKKQ